jgi:sec-independent protein translocase protein TatA
MGGFSLIHWIILGILLLLLFGGSRFSTMMGDVAKGLKSFKQGLTEDDDKAKTLPPQQVPPPASQQPIDVTARPAEPAAPPPPADNQTR